MQKPALDVDELQGRVVKFVQFQELKDFRNQMRVEVLAEKRNSDKDCGIKHLNQVRPKEP